MEVPDKKYPVGAKYYKLYEEVGDGVSASVHRALCIPFNEVVAIKVLDLERCHNDLDGIRREVHTMSLIDHPNVLRAHCSFTSEHNLWVVMPYMAGGSCLHIMKYSYPEGFEEPIIASVLRETLKALVYLHAHGHIHRDVKAGNILLDTNGSVKVADFGVSACIFDTGDRQRSRNTFVGTPCWMAPEVMQQLHGYDFKADIWSFGITALELAHGHAPFSKYPPMKVLLMTLQNAPPGLDYERDKRFSKSFREMLSACLVKDPKKRPSSEKLLKYPFFKQAKSPEYLSRTILDGLPPLADRYSMLKAKEADLLLQNKAMYGDQEQLSQQEYIRGISAWNFNLNDLKSQAALIQDDDSVSAAEINNLDVKLKPSPEETNNSNTSESHEDEFEDLDSLEGSLASLPIQPLQALKGYFDVGEDSVKNTSYKSISHTEAEIQQADNQHSGRIDGDNLARSSSLPQFAMSGQKKVLSGPLFYDNIGSSRRHVGDGDRNYSGPISYRQRRDSVDDSSEGAVVQRRGRFQVTSAELSSKGSASLIPGSTAGPTSPFLPSSAILPSLHRILQQNNMQQDGIKQLIKQVEQGNLNESADAFTNGISQALPVSARESELCAQVMELQQRIESLLEELQRQKFKNAQLERRVNAFTRSDQQTER
ncbi:serine/threonine-protein kinase BLUS1-like [Silene latifolia]|uniref:serine/threonine-protein kinase BLUS1-like n=1 Tax=Silene latifolia TaxID=37657 RepID=UPI003D77B349